MPPAEAVYVREFGPLLHAWRRLGCGTIDEFWQAQPWEVAAALGISPYGPRDDDTEGSAAPRSRSGQRVRSETDRRFGYEMPQMELIRQRKLHAMDPDRYPAPTLRQAPTTGALATTMGR